MLMQYRVANPHAEGGPLPSIHSLLLARPEHGFMLPPIFAGANPKTAAPVHVSGFPTPDAAPAYGVYAYGGYDSPSISHWQQSSSMGSLPMLNQQVSAPSPFPVYQHSHYSYQGQLKPSSFPVISASETNRTPASALAPPTVEEAQSELFSPRSSIDGTLDSTQQDRALTPTLSNISVDSFPIKVEANSETIKKAAPWKHRKKKQCTVCKEFFSNLATHKSTHLKPTARAHVCKYCNRGFARSNDLLRHIRCHWKEIGSDKGQFKCPFKSEGSRDHCCHNTGIFSRCDTFKNHMKAIHFQYPSGTRRDQRNKVAGNCRACNKYFSNVDEWLSEHVEKNQCEFSNKSLKNE